MKTKYHTNLGGRVGGVNPPYRDHHITGGRVALRALCAVHIETTSYIQTKNNLKRGSLDTPFAVTQGYSTTGSAL